MFQQPVDMSLPVYPHVKVGIVDQYYRCPYCKGWIKGQPYEAREDSAGFLAGRRGVTTSCIRCGSEISFEGVQY